jgi:hypothetical protein
LRYKPKLKRKNVKKLTLVALTMLIGSSLSAYWYDEMQLDSSARYKTYSGILENLKAQITGFENQFNASGKTEQLKKNVAKLCQDIANEHQAVKSGKISFVEKGQRESYESGLSKQLKRAEALSHKLK